MLSKQRRKEFERPKIKNLCSYALLRAIRLRTFMFEHAVLPFISFAFH